MLVLVIAFHCMFQVWKSCSGFLKFWFPMWTRVYSLLLIVIYLLFFPIIFCLIVGIFQLNMLGIIYSLFERYCPPPLFSKHSHLTFENYGTEKIQWCRNWVFARRIPSKGCNSRKEGMFFMNFCFYLWFS